MTDVAAGAASGRTVVVGAGAVGSYFGAMLALAGQRVTLIGRDAHVAAIARDGLQLVKGGRTTAVAVDATTSLDAVAGADLVLFCVKSTDTAATATAIAPRLAPDALVLSLQNGVDNPAAIAERLTGTQAVVPTAVYVATEMPRPGVVEHHGRGDLVVGPLDATLPDPSLRDRLQAVIERFAAAGVDVRHSDAVMVELWRKLLVNCAFNAISAVTQRPYGEMVAVPEIAAVQHAVVDEVVAAAAVRGIALSAEDGRAAVAAIAAAMPAQRSSTAQDLARGKPTEIDFLNGTIVRIGDVAGIATPVNRTLHALVRLAERSR